MSVISSPLPFLLLEDGTFFEGKAFGYTGLSFGEIVFNTGMTGYQEVLTDPSYFGQVVTFTYPEIGNTGINDFDSESLKPFVKAVIVRNYSKKQSNWRSNRSFNDWLVENKIVGLYGIDTRALVRHLRQFGSMNGVVNTDLKLSINELYERLQKQPTMKGLNLADEVSTKKTYLWDSASNVQFDQRVFSKPEVPYRVVALDFGIKKSILDRLVAHGCEVNVVPSNSQLKNILDYKPDGVFLSNGPGDPAAVVSAISMVKDLLAETNLPIFGICLGHQILGLALGGKTFKLPFGHRGLNHPCGQSGRLEITSQNHGFALEPESLINAGLEVTHFNLNDQTVAGISFRNGNVFGVQYHPEASPGPHDADHHFARFVQHMEEHRSSVV